MSKDNSKELKQLKRDYFELEEIFREEKESLLKVNELSLQQAAGYHVGS